MDSVNNSLSPDGIKSALESLGYDLKDRGDYWHTSALYRGGDNPTALQIWKDSGVWRDFVYSPSEKPKPFKALIEFHLNTKDPSVIEKYFKLGGGSPKATSSQSDRIVMEKIFKDSILEDLLPHYKFYNDRGIDDEVIELLRGGMSTQGKMLQRFVFPIYNDKGLIHGLTGRDMTNSKDAKWKHDGRTSKWIYPYFAPSSGGDFPIQEAIAQSGSVILVESVGDLLNLHQHGFKNCLVTFGLSISPSLLCRLCGYSFSNKRIIISFNNDSNKSVNRGARAAVKNYLKLLNHFDCNNVDICLPTKNDFGDMRQPDFDQWTKKCGANRKEKCNSILDFAIKMKQSKELPISLAKNIKILEQYVRN
jgi:hypothetical protein